ncbi:hypothetical protein F5Y07DRAFT_1271 [Xylaria sp. FL0933]|nr:hypothetical protein F5Y07DRAFT_1271 [Xylaria sp. FL0933]
MAPAISHKRKMPLGGLQRRVRARREDIEPEIEEYSEEEGNVDGESDDVSDRERQMSDESDSASGSDDDDEEEEDEDEDEEDPSSAVTQVSFGALAKAQASMPSIRRKRGRRVTNSEDEDEDEEGEDVGEKGDERWPSKSDSSKSSNPPKKLPQRSSKHAPTEISSKRMVSRKREVVSVNKVAPRDPRFSAASGAVDEARARKAYAFLDEYRDAEMAQLRAAIKKTKSAGEKEALARALKSMQSRKEAQARKDAERELVAQHRRQEKELVAQGKKKQPFYLKKSEQKKQLLLERFAGMKKKQVDRTIERRRKKLTARERRNMPVARRDAT